MVTVAWERDGSHFTHTPMQGMHVLHKKWIYIYTNDEVRVMSLGVGNVCCNQCCTSLGMIHNSCDQRLSFCKSAKKGGITG